MWVNYLSKVISWQPNDTGSEPGPSDPETAALTTLSRRLTSHYGWSQSHVACWLITNNTQNMYMRPDSWKSRWPGWQRCWRSTCRRWWCCGARSGVPWGRRERMSSRRRRWRRTTWRPFWGSPTSYCCPLCLQQKKSSWSDLIQVPTGSLSRCEHNDTC